MLHIHRRSKYTLISSLFCLCLLLTSCYRSDPWQNLKIKTGNTTFNSAKLIYPSTQFSHDLEIELLYANEILHAYINVYLEEIPPYHNDEKVAAIKIETKNEKSILLVDRLSGGQRLKIPEDQLSLFINLLKKNPYVILSLAENYKTKINTKDFKTHFKKLKTKPLDIFSNNPIGVSL